MTQRMTDTGFSGGTDYFGSPLGYRKYVNAFGSDRSAGQSFSAEHGYACTILEERYSIAYSLVGIPCSSASCTFGVPRKSDFPSANKATKGLWDKLTQSDFNAGVFAGEFRETVQFIADTVSRIAKSVWYVRRGQFRQAASHLTLPSRGSIPARAANEWLTYKYALVPLLADIKAAYELLTKPYQTVKRLRSSVIEEERARLRSGYPVYSWGWHRKAVREIRGAIKLDVSLADRVGLTDPASIAWELTRLSFVIDWLIPVGNFLQAINARNKLGVVDGHFWQTRHYREEISGLSYSGDGSTYVRSGTGGEGDFMSYAVVFREPLDSLPVTLPTIENPLGLSYDKYVTATALLAQALRR